MYLSSRPGKQEVDGEFEGAEETEGARDDVIEGPGDGCGVMVGTRDKVGVIDGSLEGAVEGFSDTVGAPENSSSNQSIAKFAPLGPAKTLKSIGSPGGKVSLGMTYSAICLLRGG